MVVVFVTLKDVTFVEDWGDFGREVEAEKRSLLDLLTFREHEVQWLRKGRADTNEIEEIPINNRSPAHSDLFLFYERFHYLPLPC